MCKIPTSSSNHVKCIESCNSITLGKLNFQMYMISLEAINVTFHVNLAGNSNSVVFHKTKKLKHSLGMLC